MSHKYEAFSLTSIGFRFSLNSLVCRAARFFIYEIKGSVYAMVYSKAVWLHLKFSVFT